jgi:N-acetylmuramoyl-L-alanine amidase
MLLEVILAASIERTCLAENLYHEARGESIDGQLMVAEVTINRVLSPDFPNTVCEVVNQPGQFSWVGKGLPINEKEVYEEIVWLVDSIAEGSTDLLGTDALYFGTGATMGKQERIGKYGSHYFFE